MKKNEFEVFTRKDYGFMPANLIVIKEKNGWLINWVKDTKWYVNSTNDSADCDPSENEKALKAIVKALKPQMASV